MSPSTHQDSPKVPWPVMELVRAEGDGEATPPWVPGPGENDINGFGAETYFPISALLSDEVVEATQVVERLARGDRTNPMLERLKDAARSALSQPEHQGDGHRIEIRWDGDHGMPPVLLLRHPETGCDPGEGATEGCWLDGWLENADEPEGMLRGTVTAPVTYELDGDQPVFYLQPPVPLLSDEEGERLNEIADELDPPVRPSGPVPFKSEVDAAAFLRTLASQEPTS